MRKLTTITVMTLIALVMVLSGALATDMMTTEKRTSATQYATNIIGATVNNLQGEILGKIIDLTIDQNRITFAILSHGGILGVGDKLIPVPMSSLSIKDEKTVLLDISKNQLAKAPSFDKSSRPDFSNRQWTEDTYRFYGAQPFWKEKSKEKVMEHEEKVMDKEVPMKDQIKDKMQQLFDDKSKSKY